MRWKWLMIWRFFNGFNFTKFLLAGHCCTKQCKKNHLLLTHPSNSDQIIVLVARCDYLVYQDYSPDSKFVVQFDSLFDFCCCCFSPSFPQTAVKGAVAPNKLILCNGSTSGSSDCEIMKESPATFSRGFHFPHTYVVFLCVSLGSALLVSSAFIMSYYYWNVRKKVKEEEEDIPSGDWSTTLRTWNTQTKTRFK